MDIKVSVIIPIYNGEKYLRECLDTVCNQTLEEIEIICVDDGSTDSSYDILKEYQEKDDRIQIIQQKNQFAGAARNAGKKIAKGEYLIFWDCDDFFELEALEELYSQCKEMDADVCVCGGNHYYEDRKTLSYFAGYLTETRVPESNLFNRETNEDYILNFTNEATWNKMFRREFIERERLDFQCVRNGNDVYFTVCAICLAERITTVQKRLINYRKNQKNSLVGTLSKSPDTPFKAWIAAAEHLREKNAFPERSFMNKVTGSMIYLFRNIQNADSFYSTVEFMQKEGLKKLQVEEKEADFYYNKIYPEFIHHILNDTPQEFQTFLLHLTYIELTERSSDLRMIRKENRRLNRLNQKLERQNEEIRQSWSFRIGQKIVWLPGKIKRLFKKQS